MIGDQRKCKQSRAGFSTGFGYKLKIEKCTPYEVREKSEILNNACEHCVRKYDKESFCPVACT